MLQAAEVATFTLSLAARHAFTYVVPSHPQIGLATFGHSFGSALQVPVGFTPRQAPTESRQNRSPLHLMSLEPPQMHSPGLPMEICACSALQALS